MFAAQALARVDADVTIVDRHNYHLFQPLLYQVAAAGLPPSDVAWPVRAILRRQLNATVLLGEVTAIDTARDVIVLVNTMKPHIMASEAGIHGNAPEPAERRANPVGVTSSRIDVRIGGRLNSAE